MALDGIILGKVKEQLCSYLPMHINKINNTSDTEVIFNVHAKGKRTSLVVSLHSIYNHIALSDESYNNFEEPSTFVMVLRKYLINGVITQIDQFEYDRYLLIHIKNLDELYDDREYLLSVELMGKYANLILIDNATGKIIDALKKIPPFQNTRRTILQGAVFTLPESQHKLDPYLIKSPDMNASLVSQLQGFSKQLEAEVRFRNEKESFSSIMETIAASKEMYISENGEYHVLPLTHLSLPYQTEELMRGFDVLYYKANEVERIKKVTEDIYKFIRRQIKHYETKLVKLSASKEEATHLEEDRENGDLLFTYSDLEKRGLKKIDVTDYNGETRTIVLDPRYSVKDNARRYYNSYTKKRKGQVYIEEQIQIAENELNYFNALKEQLSIASYNDALQIKEELIRYGYLRKQKQKTKKIKKINLYQVSFHGFHITFGKNNIQNDFLTFDYAHSNDTWFHAKDYHGAHLVVDTDKPDEETLRLCANLAAYFSSGRLSSSVPVDYCLVKNVKKIKGGKAGFVTIRNQKTIYIDPDLDQDLTIVSI